uniref:Uncharacterized protein n=1 Tax=Arundo donax TaxID=35708 RepID=A0A0A9CJ55_ARUDO
MTKTSTRRTTPAATPTAAPATTPKRWKVRQRMDGKVKVKEKEKVKVRGKLEWKRKAKVKPIRLILIKGKVMVTRFRALWKENSMTEGWKLMQEAWTVKMKDMRRGR